MRSINCAPSKGICYDKKATTEDAGTLAGLAVHDLKDLEAEFCKSAANDDTACFIRYVEDKPVGYLPGTAFEYML